MLMKEVFYENGRFWVKHVGKGAYEVYRNDVTAARRVAQVTYSNDPEKAAKRAIAECNRRANKE